MNYCNVQDAVNRNRKRPVIARSAFMRCEEIDREREQSGWNQYADEEEFYDEQMPQRMPEQMRQRMPENEQMPQRMPEEMQMRQQMPENPQNMQGQPYFRMPDYTQVLEEQKNKERDLRKMQAMYPEAAKILLPYIEEECDKMEYEGSTMFDEYPDRTTIQRLQENITGQVRDQFPQEEAEAPDDMLSMQYQGRRNRPGKNWLEDLTRVLLLQEMHHRRCRHRECRRGRW